MRRYWKKNKGRRNSCKLLVAQVTNVFLRPCKGCENSAVGWYWKIPYVRHSSVVHIQGERTWIRGGSQVWLWESEEVFLLVMLMALDNIVSTLPVTLHLSRKQEH